MHRSRWVTFFALLFAACVAGPQVPPSHGDATPPSLKLARLPLGFEPIVDRFAEGMWLICAQFDSPEVTIRMIGNTSREA
jgi:hypothetical protein